MNRVQLLIFEIGTRCNLAHQHRRHCPNLHRDRWEGTEGRRLLTDELVERIAADAYEHQGFAGLIGWHYYCEPTLYWPRVKRLMGKIRIAVPKSRFLLWTNGVKLPPRCELAILDHIEATHYAETDRVGLSALCNVKRVVEPTWDTRLVPVLSPVPTTRGCPKPLSEFIINAYGQVLLCCYDWRGAVKIGNVWDEPFCELVKRWQGIRDSVVVESMNKTAPDRCRRCGSKYNDMSYVFDK